MEDRETYMSKTHDQIHERDYVLTNKSKKAIMQRLHRKLMNQLVAMEIKGYKEQRRFAMTGLVMVSIALLAKVKKKNFPGRVYVSQIERKQLEQIFSALQAFE